MWLRSQRPLESSMQHVSQCPKPVDVTLYSKRDLADVVKLRVLRWGDGLGVAGWAQRHHRVPVRGRQEGQCQRD